MYFGERIAKKARSGGVKSGMNSIDEIEARKERYLLRILDMNAAKKEESIRIRKNILAYAKNKAKELAEKESSAVEKSNSITKYAIEHGCSRSVARKKMSRERRSLAA